MNTKEKQAKLKSTGKIITVYRSSQRDTWIDSADLETEYTPEQLEF